MIITVLTFAILSLASVPVAEVTITENKEVFTLTSPKSGELTVSRTVVVNSKDGISEAALELYCDSFRSLQSFSGFIMSAGSKPEKLKKKDLTSVALSEGLDDDDLTYYYTPSGQYPMTVHYEYKMLYHGGLAQFPTFFPVESEKAALEKASYEVNVPAGYGIKYYGSQNLEFNKLTENGRDRYCWTVTDFEPIVAEDLMPSVLERLPYLYASPEIINLGGYEGSQKTWRDLGLWLFNLQDGCQNLSEEEKARVRDMTADCATNLEKLQVLYKYLRDRTRYVSIQLGIGGLRPFPAAEVSKMGFGDCKGLSNYMKALLAAAGIESDYYIISTRRANLFEDYVSPGQMDHVMLAVPMPEIRDTVWVECTNPALPLGYRHVHAAGHEVVLVKQDGGERVRIPAYPDSLSRRINSLDVTILPTGFAKVSAHRTLTMAYAESTIGFTELIPTRQVQRISAGFKILTEDVAIDAVTDNFGDFIKDGKDYVPRMDFDYHFVTASYGNVSGNRLFIPVNPWSRLLPVQKSKRVNELYLRGTDRLEDVIVLHLPYGYTLEGVPEDVSIDSDFGALTSTIKVSEDGRTIEIHQSMKMKPFRKPAEEYGAYRDFARAVGKAYSANIVLKTSN